MSVSIGRRLVARQLTREIGRYLANKPIIDKRIIQVNKLEEGSDGRDQTLPDMVADRISPIHGCLGPVDSPRKHIRF